VRAPVVAGDVVGVSSLSQLDRRFHGATLPPGKRIVIQADAQDFIACGAVADNGNDDPGIRIGLDQTERAARGSPHRGAASALDSCKARLLLFANRHG
jgi:hypothetical protein